MSIVEAAAAPPLTDRGEAYWLRDMEGIGGWLVPNHYQMIRMVDALQRGAGVTGHIGEIGVYHGKFLLGMAQFADPGTKVTAIDVFEDQTRNVDGAGVGSLDRLKENIAAYGPPGLDYAFIKADSIAMTAMEKIDVMRDRGPFRLFSVDGCHTHEHTHNDLLTAQDLVAPGGVVVLDDYMQPHWPGVTEAVSTYMRTVPRLQPFLFCSFKLYFVGAGWHAQYVEAFRGLLGNRDDVRVTRMHGVNVVTQFP